VPMMPVVESFRRTSGQIFAYSLLVAATSLLFGFSAGMGPLYWSVSSLLGLVFCAMAARLWLAPSEARAMQLFHYSITYVTLLFCAMAADQLLR